jgi:hypothetical protein
MKCMGFVTEDRLAAEAQNYGAAGGRPQVVWPNGILASTAVGLFVQTILPWSKQSPVPILVEYDGNAAYLGPSNKLKYLVGRRCNHYSTFGDLGDPLYGRD